MGEEQKDSTREVEKCEKVEEAVENETNLNDKIDFLIGAVQAKSTKVPKDWAEDNPYVFMIDMLNVFKILHSKIEKLEASPFNNIPTITKEELDLHKVEYNAALTVNSCIPNPDTTKLSFMVNKSDGIDNNFEMINYHRFDLVQESADFTVDLGDIYDYNKGICYIWDKSGLSLIKMEVASQPSEGDEFLWLVPFGNDTMNEDQFLEKYRANEIWLTEVEAKSLIEQISKFVE